MNERIKELALRAGGRLSCIAEPLEHPWKFSQSELEKFAELIVAECIGVVQKGGGMCGAISSNNLKQHFFEVEE